MDFDDLSNTVSHCSERLARVLWVIDAESGMNLETRLSILKLEQ